MVNTASASQAGDLLALARVRFGDLSVAEMKLLKAAPKAEIAVCGPNDDWDDPKNDPAKADKWGADRKVRAELIRWICVERVAKERIDPKGVQAFGARVVGKLDLSYVVVPFGLTLQRCHLMEDAAFYSTELPELDLRGTWVRSLNADSISVKRSVFLHNGFRAEGEVRLIGAEIGEALLCDHSVFTNPSKVALNADRMSVKGSAFLRSGFRAEGEVRLLGAQIGSNLECDNSVFTNPSKMALNADRIKVAGYVFLRSGFSAEGEVNFLHAEIGGNLECDTARLKNPPLEGVPGSGKVLNADGISVKGSIFLRDGFRTEGEVRLPGAQIGGDLECTGSTLLGKLDGHGAAIKGTLFWTGIANSSQAQLDLRNATAGSFEDDGEKSWPSPGKLFLDGFVYGRFSGGPRTAKERLLWLDRLNFFTPQPYRQLAKVLKDEGDDDGAREALVEMARKESGTSWTGQALQLPWRAIGYGYYPLRALVGLGILTGLGWILYRRAYLAGAVTPTEKEAYEEFKKPGRLPPRHYRRFFPFIYSLENSLPLVKLGQADSWQPEPNIPGPLSPNANWAFRLGHFVGSLRHAGEWRARFTRYTASPVFLHRFFWAQILLGWILATLFVAGVTGLVR